jgi:hypothetical protein
MMMELWDMHSRGIKELTWSSRPGEHSRVCTPDLSRTGLYLLAGWDESSTIDSEWQSKIQIKPAEDQVYNRNKQILKK